MADHTGRGSLVAPDNAGTRRWRPDLLAGLTAAAVVVPKAMAYATVAGLPVAVGLYTAFVPMVVYALLGTSRVLSVSTTTTLAILAGTELALVVPDGDPARLVVASATLAGLVGALLVAAAALRLGFVANFISESVLTGFKAGVGLVIVLDQAPKLLGLHLPQGSFVHKLLALFGHLPQTSWVTLLLALATLAVLLGMERLLPHSPAPLVAVGGGIVATWLLGLDALGVATVGAIPKGLPHLTLPDLTLVADLLPGAFGIALMSFTESIAAGRAFRTPAEPPIQANRELLATGVGNLAGSFFGAMPAGGGTSQTAVVRALGGRSQLASLITAGAAVATMLFLAPVIGLMPQATLAAVVIVYSIGLIQPAEFVAIRRVRWMELRWAALACLGVLLFGTLQGIVVAVIISLLGLAWQAANLQVHSLGRKPGTQVFRPASPEHPEDETFPGLLLARPEGSLFFVNAQRVGERLAELIESQRPTVVALDMSGVPDVEYSALKMLIEGERRAKERGVKLWLVALNPGVLEMVRRSGLADRLGRKGMFFNAQAAVEHYTTTRPV
jgi:sulfate permease, SulP family